MSNNGISLLGVLFLGFLGILALSYFNISIQSVVESPKAQDNLEYVGGGTVDLWQKYFKGPATYLWKDVFVNILWKTFVENMERIRDGKYTEDQNSAPT